MDWPDLLLEEALQGDIWAVSIVSSIVCIALYHKIIQVPKQLKLQNTLDIVNNGIKTILRKLDIIDEKVQVTEKDNAFLRGLLKIDTDMLQKFRGGTNE